MSGFLTRHQYIKNLEEQQVTDKKVKLENPVDDKINQTNTLFNMARKKK